VCRLRAARRTDKTHPDVLKMWGFRIRHGWHEGLQPERVNDDTMMQKREAAGRSLSCRLRNGSGGRRESRCEKRGTRKWCQRGPAAAVGLGPPR
jgi:hypothetical protein